MKNSYIRVQIVGKNVSNYLKWLIRKKIETKENKKYVFKKSNDNINKNFKYLCSRNYNFFPNYTDTKNYNVYEYVEGIELPKEEKAKDIINLISLLHTKTTHYKKIDIDEYKEIYEEIEKQIKELEEYFIDINNKIEEEVYMSPSHYLLIRNISKIYSNIEFCKQTLENWYNLVKDKENKRVSFIHNNLKLSHYIKNEKEYLISWDKSKFDMPIYDLYNFYKNNYNDINMNILLNQYEQRYPLTKDELLLLFLLISLPNKIEFINNDYENTKKVDSLLNYIYKTDKLILEYNSN